MKTLTNIELSKMLSKHKLLCNDICYKSDLKPHLTNGWYIINMQDHTRTSKGTHWVAFYCGSKTPSVYFDSFGIDAPEIVDRKLKHFISSNKQIQDSDSDSCGWFCFLIIYFFENKAPTLDTFNDFINFWASDTKKNEAILTELMSKIEKI